MKPQKSEEFRLLIPIEMSLACTFHRTVQYHFLTSNLCRVSHLKVLSFRSRARVGILRSTDQLWFAAYFCKVSWNPATVICYMLSVTAFILQQQC